MALSKEEKEKMKERAQALTPDEKESLIEALEPDILKKVATLLNGAPTPAPTPTPKPKKSFLDTLLGTGGE